MGKKFCGWMLHLLGWTADAMPVPEERCIILGVPHTCIGDFLISYLYYTSVGGKARIMVKKEFFFPPVGWILKKLGAIPVDRANPASLVKSLIEEMDKGGQFHLCIAPEGTRKGVHKWKTGYHFIATHCNIPVYMGYFNWATKHISRGDRVVLADTPSGLTDNARADTDAIQAKYEAMNLGAKHPEKYFTK